MTSTLLNEKLISLSQACARFPGSRGAERKHPATLTRYIRKGCRGLNGQRVRLEAIRDGNRFLTSEEALARFIAACTAVDPVKEYQPSTARDQADEVAERELARMGGFKPRKP